MAFKMQVFPGRSVLLKENFKNIKCDNYVGVDIAALNWRVSIISVCA